MPQRFYFDDNVFWDNGGSNPATPAYHSGWHEDNTALRVKLPRSRPGNAFSASTIQKNTAGQPKYMLDRVYVSEPLQVPFTLSGTVKGQRATQEQGAGNDCMAALVIRVWNSDTNTFRSPDVLVYQPTTLTSEFDTVGTQNRFFPPEIPITPVNVKKGDRIVVEIGAASFNAGSGVGTTLTFETGSSGLLDLPVDEAYRTPSAASWIEFSMTFPSLAPKTSGISVRLSGGKLLGVATDYLVSLESPTGARYDVTDRLALEGLSTVTLTVERNLTEFRAGDVTLTFDDGDGFFSDLFSTLTPADRWKLNIERDHARHFAGIVPGIDSVKFDRKAFTVELTALDLSKLLEDVSAETVARPADIYALGANIAVNDTTITLNSTAGLFNGDKLRIDADGLTEEFTVSLITSSTVFQTTAPAGHAFTAADATVTLTTPFYRFQTPEFLINALLDEAGSLVGGRDVFAPTPFPGTPMFSEVNTAGLPSTAVPTAFLQKASKHLARVGSAVFDQVTVADAWVGAGTDRNWIDWSPYRTQAEGEPATFATVPVGSLNGETLGVDLTPGALVVYQVAVDSGDTTRTVLNKYTSADGFTWAGPTLVAVLGDFPLFLNMHSAGGDYDSIRDRVYYTWDGDLGAEFGYWDVAGATKVVLDASARRFLAGNNNVRFSKEFDGVVVYNSSSKSIEIWRGSVIVLTLSSGIAPSWSPKQTRYFGGAWYTVGYPLGVPTVLFSNDNFVNVQQVQLAEPPPSGGSTRHLTIVNGTIRVVVNAAPNGGGAAIARYYVASDSADWTISYADFSGMSITDAIDELAIILNCVFRVDVNGVSRFGPRALGTAERTTEIDHLVVERSDELVWLELYDFVEIKLRNGETASAGTPTSTSRNLSIDVQLIDATSVAYAVAVYLLDFYEKKRGHPVVKLEDDGTPFGVLDVIGLDGVDWIVYNIERELADYVVTLELVEKVE